MQRWCRFSVTFLRVIVVVFIELAFKARLTSTSCHHQAKYSIWIGTVCALWVFLCLASFYKAFFYLWCTTKSLLLKTWRFFSFRVGIRLISKLEIITWSCSLCFFLYNFSSYSSTKKQRFRSLLCWWRAQPHLLHILDKFFLYQAMLGSDAPSFCFCICAIHYTIMPFAHFSARLVAPWLDYLFREERCRFESPSGSGEKVEYVPGPGECPNICTIWHRVGSTTIFAFGGT